MTLIDRITENIKTAMKAKDKVRLEAVRSIKKVLIEKNDRKLLNLFEKFGFKQKSVIAESDAGIRIHDVIIQAIFCILRSYLGKVWAKLWVLPCNSSKGKLTVKRSKMP